MICAGAERRDKGGNEKMKKQDARLMIHETEFVGVRHSDGKQGDTSPAAVVKYSKYTGSILLCYRYSWSATWHCAVKYCQWCRGLYFP